MPHPIEFNLKTSGSRNLASYLNSLEEPSEEGFEVKIAGLSGEDYVGAGVRYPGTLLIAGSVGDFSFMSYGVGEVVVDGCAGNFLGHSLHSGSIVVKQNAGDCLGAMGSGGLITVYGNAGNKAGFGLQGADILIRGNVGCLLGMGMTDGNIVVGGTVGPDMGKGMTGGSIFVRGEPTSVSSHIEECRMREPDKLKIGLLMLKAGIKSTGKEFRLFRPVV